MSAAHIQQTISVESHGDRFQDSADVAQDVIIPESQDAVAVVGKPSVAHEVPLISCVLPAIDLDD